MQCKRLVLQTEILLGMRFFLCYNDLNVYLLNLFFTLSCKSRIKNVHDDSIFECRVVLECLEIISVYKKFYENHTAMSAIKSMLRISYCVYTSLKDKKVLFEEIVQGICNILVRYVFLISLAIYYIKTYKCT